MTPPHIPTIGARVKWLREQKDMGQAKLARAIGITPQSLCAIELNKTKAPASSTLLRIAAVLDANPDWIINGRGDPRKVATTGDIIKDMVAVMRELTPEQQQTLLAVAQTLRR